MELNTLQVVATGQGASAQPLSAASSGMSLQAAQTITAIANDTALSPSERSALVGAVAGFDQSVSTKSTRAALFAQVEGFGTYLRNTSSNSWPKWEHMTALRVYGLNLESGKKSFTEEAAAAQMQVRLENIAQSSRGQSVQQLVAASRAAVEARAVVVDAPKPKAAPAPDAPVRNITREVATRAVKVDTVA
jgi:hypothetical protein